MEETLIWFHTFALPIATVLALAIGIKKRAPLWKLAALVVGCGLMLSGLWLHTGASTLLLVAGGVLFVVGVPRLATKAR